LIFGVETGDNGRMAIYNKFITLLAIGAGLTALIGIFWFFGFGETQIPSHEENPLIRLDSPRAGETIQSPLLIKGEARGNWFFEATFPIVLTDWDGLIIAQSYATSDGEWMTENFVPFYATLEFKKPDYGGNGFLILQKSNPSGLPEHDDALEIPIKF